MPIQPFVDGFLVTLQLCVLAAIGALVLGALIAALRVSPIAPLRAVGTAYVTVFRNIPLTVVIFFAAFGLPELGMTHADFLKIPVLSEILTQLKMDVPFFRFAVIALVTYTAAFVCEAFRAGINAVSPGQAEAARSLGLTFTQNLRFVVFPQAWKYAIVPLGSVIIAMLKNSALAGALGGVSGDLFGTVDTLISSSTVESAATTLEAFIGVSIGYLIMTVPLGLFLDRVEKKRAMAR
ncbi:amino acid ABC transporter permease [Allorhizocola rhizosphaerae]|uniref:amino acid ABC transporter permease n=1 Tax=Allorhizocola rhizosphaerae TaxID=1872709 RepID=UPI000E3C09D7|nr:amino acid ABC transporter permease [Allorhizocola rhizosphaerae]